MRKYADTYIDILFKQRYAGNTPWHHCVRVAYWGHDGNKFELNNKTPIHYILVSGTVTHRTSFKHSM